MINTQHKFEAKIPNGSKVVTFTRNHTKFLSFKANLTLNIKVKVTSFQSEIFMLENSSIWNVKFKTVQFLTVTTKILEV